MGLTIFSKEPLSRAIRRSLEDLTNRPDVLEVAAMPDVHLAREVCVGAVVATERTLYPEAVGGDIGCGMAAVRLAGTIELDDSSVAKLFRALERAVPILRAPPADPSPALERPLSSPLLRTKRRLAQTQLGTLGRGNHFVELQVDDRDFWLMVHTGSRGIGRAIRQHHGRGRSGLDVESPEGRAYLADMGWALDYAEENRRRIIRAAAVAFGLEAEPDTLITCHHNYVRKERFGWVHRKGAISAYEGEAGIIPGSMGEVSHHVIGRGDPRSLCSSSHGAGRQMSRTEARRRIRRDDLKRQMRGIWYDERRAEQLVDEAPSAYKNFSKVMRAQRTMTKVVRTLRPLLVYKG